MAFTEIELNTLSTLLAHVDVDAGTVTALRDEFPGRSITRCDASDMGGDAPFREFDAIDLYLVDGRDHCWKLTDDPSIATGMVLAKRRRTIASPQIVESGA